MDLSLERIEAAQEEIDPVFLDTPQFVDERLSAALGREVLVKVETLNPIGSFKGRGTWLLAQDLDPARSWVCATAGNFGQGLAYAARAGRACRRIRLRRREPSEGGADAGHWRSGGGQRAARLGGRARRGQRVLVKDGLHPAIAEGAGTIGVELGRAAPVDAVIAWAGMGPLSQASPAGSKPPGRRPGWWACARRSPGDGR